jgi:hypothetical protein
MIDDDMPNLLPDNPLPDPVSDSDRVAVIARLHDLAANGDVGIEQFSASLEQVLAADSQTELEAAAAGLPSLVRLTPAWRKLSEPVVLDAAIYRLQLGSGWQLAVDTTVRTNTAKVLLDLTEATWDARDVQLRLETNTGKIVVIIPKGVTIQMVSQTGRVVMDNLSPPLPGGPVLRINAKANTGKISFTHERPPTKARHWWRRRSEQPGSAGSA